MLHPQRGLARHIRTLQAIGPTRYGRRLSAVQHRSQPSGSLAPAGVRCRAAGGAKLQATPGCYVLGCGLRMTPGCVSRLVPGRGNTGTGLSRASVSPSQGLLWRHHAAGHCDRLCLALAQAALLRQTAHHANMPALVVRVTSFTNTRMARNVNRTVPPIFCSCAQIRVVNSLLPKRYFLYTRLIAVFVKTHAMLRAQDLHSAKSKHASRGHLPL